MLRYLINVTAIWAVCLLLFDVFLRKERFHGYNRAYLLLCLLAGIVLPMLTFNGIAMTTAVNIPPQVPVGNVYHAAPTVGTAAAASQWPQLIFIIYCLGVSVALCMLFVDVLKLLALYRDGKRSAVQNWLLIETGKEHASFSFFNMLFVSNRNVYSAEQWQMILVHEREHKVLFHFADVILLQLLRTVCWFHPLVYIFNQRLLLVHEYQADQAISQQPELYGTFLIEQSLLGGAPSIAQTFNRSPIKNRIIMLTPTSTTASKWKTILVLPLALVCTTCFSKNSFSQKFEQTGNGSLLQGNKIEMTSKGYDTITVIDPIVGTETTKISITDPIPVKMNGLAIQEFAPAEGSKEFNTLMENSNHFFLYLMDNLRQQLSLLEDGTYCITPAHVIINEQGMLAYFEPVGITQMTGSKTKSGSTYEIDGHLKKTLDSKILELLQNCPNPGSVSVNGKNMPYGIGNLNITVKNHQAFAL